MKDIIFVTSSQNKINEFERILGFKINHQDLDIDELQSLDYEKIIKDKVQKAHQIIKKPVVVEDSGMVFNAWNVLPGPLWRYFEDRETGLNHNELLCKMLSSFSDKSAVGATIFAYFDGKILETFKGKTEGTIVCPACGENGFGYDAIFVPSGGERTFAQMSPEEKDKFSPRNKALDKLKIFIKTIN